jgi:hypothetical protein
MDLVYYSYYDVRRGWDNTNPGWHTLVLEDRFGELDVDKLHQDVVQWIMDTVENPLRHCVWHRTDHAVAVRFRYERDYIVATLRWQG